MDIEKIFLSELLLADRNDQIDFYSQLGEKYFYTYKWKNYFNAFGKILIVLKKDLDTINIHNECKNEDWYLPSELNDLQNAASSSANIGRNIAILKERSYRKELLEVLDKKTLKLKETKWHDDLAEAKNDLIASMDAIELDRDGSDFVDFPTYENLIKEHMDSESNIEGYGWGIDDLDTLTNGITNPKLIVLGGLKKSGKSRFIINTRYALQKQGIASPFISLEMPAMELAKLHYARELKIPDFKLRSGAMLNDIETQSVKDFKMDWSLFPTECVSGLRVDQIISRIRRYSKLYPKSVIFIDYLQRVVHDRTNQASALEGISNQIADATREFDVSIVLLSQLQNLAEREVPSIGHLKGSGGIGESADIIMLLDNLYRRDKTDINKGKFRMYVEQRYGDSGVVKIWADLGICEYQDEFKKEVEFE